MADAPAGRRDFAGLPSGPAIVLVAPQMPENIGSAARAMLNFGLTDLRLVRPEKRFPHPRAEALASGASFVLERARVFDSTEAAVGDLHRLYAATAREREMLKPVQGPRQAVAEIGAALRTGERCGILFGSERVGLLNEDVVLAEKIVTIPVNPGFSSLNLAQAVAVLAYEWWCFLAGPPAERFSFGRTRPATREEVFGLFEHLERELDEAGYFAKVPDKREAMLTNIRNSLQRGPLLDQDVRTLRGIVKQLAGKRIPGSKRRRQDG
ncbi:MAG: RNA methyltransferase [Alphaproteobacteria bacterium]|nr:RNA methyltransferase [Alphaproteobacteria bacterium]